MAGVVSLYLDRNNNSNNTSNNNKSDKACVVDGLCCVYSALTPECGCRLHQEVLCLRSRANLECCCYYCYCCGGGDNEKDHYYQPLTIGADCSAPIESSSICKIGIGCCEKELIRHPRVLWGAASHQGCLRSAGAVPPHPDFLGPGLHRHYWILAKCFVQCLPTMACCAPPPDCPALDQMTNKGHYVAVVSTVLVEAAERMERGFGNDMVQSSRTAQVFSIEDSANDGVFEV